MTAPTPPFPLTRETNIRIARDGRFFHEGDPITHPALVEKLGTWVGVDAETGRYILANQVNWAFITVEDTPLVVRTVTIDAAGTLVAHVSDGTTEPLDLASLRIADDGAPYVDVRSGSLPARFGHGAAHTLLDRLEEDDTGHVTLSLPDGRTRSVPREAHAQAQRRRAR